VADKKQVRQNIGRLQRIKTWQLVVLLLLVSLIAATFMRLNNVGMIERRTAVFAADKRGDREQVKQNLYALQRYSSAHMNAGTGVLYLETLYKQDVEKARKAAETDSGLGARVMREADAMCRLQFGGNYQAYSVCVAAEQRKYTGVNGTSIEVILPNPELYRHAYFSPLWSPDFAGWTVLLGIAIALVIIARLLGLMILKLLLRRHYSSI